MVAQTHFLTACLFVTWGPFVDTNCKPFCGFPCNSFILDSEIIIWIVILHLSELKSRTSILSFLLCSLERLFVDIDVYEYMRVLRISRLTSVQWSLRWTCLKFALFSTVYENFHRQKMKFSNKFYQFFCFFFLFFIEIISRTGEKKKKFCNTNRNPKTPV